MKLNHGVHRKTALTNRWYALSGREQGWKNTVHRSFGAEFLLRAAAEIHITLYYTTFVSYFYFLIYVDMLAVSSELFYLMSSVKRTDKEQYK
jgi:hypothetical protein